jgi:hypothetical protein
MEPQAQLKMIEANRYVEGSIVDILNIRKDLIPCAGIFGIVHTWDMENHPIHYLCFFISLWVEGTLFG